MRLQPPQIQAIKQAVARVAGPDARVRLFGSRLDDLARGGDIDLLVELPHPSAQSVALESRLAAALQIALGEQRIDVLICAPGMPELPIHHWARVTGLPL